MGAIRLALGQRGLRLLLGAGLISATGDWVLRVGAPSGPAASGW